jgi:hypothetical protein
MFGSEIPATPPEDRGVLLFLAAKPLVIRPESGGDGLLVVTGLLSTSGKTHHVKAFELSYSTDEQIEQWSSDPNCENRDQCAELLK